MGSRQDHPVTRRNSKKQGFTGGEHIFISPDAKKTTGTSRREIGHTLGMDHSTGVMAESSNASLTAFSVRQTLGRVGLGNAKYGDGTGEPARRFIGGINGSRSSGFNRGQVMTVKKFQKKQRRAIKRARKNISRN